MTALAADISVQQKEAGIRSYPMAASTTIYKGALVAINASGYAVPAADSANYKVVGVAYEKIDNSAGAAAAKSVRVVSGRHFLLTATGTPTQASVGAPAYVSDDATVSVAATTTASILVGTISQYVSATQVWVFIPFGGIGSVESGGAVIADSITGGDAALAITGQAAVSATAAGGTVAVAGGAGGATSGAGGAVSLTGGASTTSGAGGAASLVGGAGAGNSAGGAASVTGGAGAGTGAGGAIAITGGASGAGATGNGGAITLTGGAAGSTDGNGGHVNLVGGAKAGTGTAGEVQINGNGGIDIVAARYSAPTDLTVFTAARAYRIKAASIRPDAAGTDLGAVTALLKKCPSGTAPSAGTSIHQSGSFDLKGTVDTNQSATLSTTVATLEMAAGDSLCLDVTGTATAAVGAITITLQPI